LSLLSAYDRGPQPCLYVSCHCVDDTVMETCCVEHTGHSRRCMRDHTCSMSMPDTSCRPGCKIFVHSRLAAVRVWSLRQQVVRPSLQTAQTQLQLSGTCFASCCPEHDAPVIGPVVIGPFTGFVAGPVCILLQSAVGLNLQYASELQCFGTSTCTQMPRHAAPSQIQRHISTAACLASPMEVDSLPMP